MAGFTRWIAIPLLFLYGCYVSSAIGKETSSPTSKSRSGNIVILFTGEENGYLEPCGCTEGQLGGMRRRYAFIKSLRKDGEIPIPISLGDVPASTDRQSEIKMDTILKAMEMMGYAVHNLGEKDIALGYEALNYLIQRHDVPFISSNVRFPGAPDINIQPYLIKKIKSGRSKMRIGFLGILSPGLVDSGSYNNVEITEPVSAIRPLVMKLRKKVDILILLSHSGVDEGVQIATELPELDLVITGHGIDEPGLYTKEVGNTLIVSAGRYGKHVGIARPLLDKKDGIMQRAADLAVNIIPLDQVFNEPSPLESLIREYHEIVKEEDLLGRYDKILLNQGDAYTGSMVCGTCHVDIYLHWKGTKHAVAHETLEKVGYQFDPECVKCHVVGLDYSGGFESAGKTPDLKDVGCESCHGFGGVHIADTAAAYGEVDEKDCMRCHDPENSPQFEYTAYWKEIEHPPEL